MTVVQVWHKGVNHAVRVAVTSGKVSLEELLAIKLEAKYGETAWGSRPMMPYSEKNLQMIQIKDVYERRSVWDPPSPSVHGQHQS